jgi:hypothetical protein
MDATFDLLRAAADGARGLVGSTTVPHELRTAIIGLQAHMDAVKVVQSLLLDEAERTNAWKGTGCRNKADWLSGTTKSSYGDAKRKQKLGKALGESEKLKDAVSNGDVSPDAAEQLADAVSNPPANADQGALDDLIDACKGADVRDAREAVNRFREIWSNETEDEAAERRYQARSLRSAPVEDGLVTTTVVLPEAQHDQFMKSINHAAGPLDAEDPRTLAQRLADGLINLTSAYAKGGVTGGRQKPTMLIVWTKEAFEGATQDPAFTDLGTRIPAHEARRLAEHAQMRRVVMAGRAVLDLGKSVRLASDEQYLALIARDGGCGMPGCRVPGAFCEVDHIIEWDPNRTDGPTDLDNLWLLCPFHHRERHRPGVRLIGNANNLEISFPDGRTLDRQWQTPAAA